MQWWGTTSRRATCTFLFDGGKIGNQVGLLKPPCGQTEVREDLRSLAG